LEVDLEQEKIGWKRIKMIFHHKKMANHSKNDFFVAITISYYNFLVDSLSFNFVLMTTVS
jgi:hypothetical protein